MKKIIGFMVLVCLVFSLTSCASKLPDPVPSVENYFKELCSPDGEVMQELLKNQAFAATIRSYPETEDAVKGYIAAFLEAIEFEIDNSKTSVNNYLGTAQFIVKVKSIEASALSERAAEIQKQVEDQAVAGVITSDEEFYNAYYELLAEVLRTESFDKTETPGPVSLIYDKEAGEWIVDNADEILRAFTTM